MKLSPAQLDILHALAVPHARLHFISSLNARWFLSGSLQTVRYATFDVLNRHGLLDTTRDSFGGWKGATISKKGLRVAKAKEGREGA